MHIVSHDPHAGDRFWTWEKVEPSYDNIIQEVSIESERYDMRKADAMAIPSGKKFHYARETYDTNNGIAYFYPDHDYDKYELFIHNFWHMFWNVSETDYLKYRLGLMDEGIWQARYAIMKRNKSRENYTSRVCDLAERAWRGKSTQLDSEFVKLINTIPSKDCVESD